MISEVLSFLMGYGVAKHKEATNTTESEESLGGSVSSNPGVGEDSSNNVDILGENEVLDRLVRLNQFDLLSNSRVVYGGYLPCCINFFNIDNLRLQLNYDLRPITISSSSDEILLLGGTRITCYTDRIDLSVLISGSETDVLSYNLVDEANWPTRLESSMGVGTLQGNIVIQGPFTSAILCMMQFRGDRRITSYPVCTAAIYYKNGLIDGAPSKLYKECSPEMQFIVDDRRGYDM